MGTLAVVEFQLRSGLAKDKVVNTFAFAEAAPVRGNGAMDASYITAITRLFTVADPALSSAIGSRLSPAVSRASNACAIKLYDITGHLDGSPHGSPRAIGNFTLPTSEDPSTGLPEEVALAITLEAENRSEQLVERADGGDAGTAIDRPRQRFTGRFYFGPVVPSMNGSDANGMSRPNAAVATSIRNMVVRMADEIDLDATHPDEAALAVWSRKDAALRGVEFVRNDDAWDTQRRRGASPTAVVRTRVGDLVPEIELAS